MAEKAKESNVIFRPHFKTHQSARIGEWFREIGTTKITVSSIRMAEYFNNNGWEDITIAFPAIIGDSKKLNELSEKIKLNIIVDNEETVKALGKSITFNTGIYIEIDPGYNRSGLEFSQLNTIERIIRIIDQSGTLTFMGFLTHAGQTYHSRTIEDIIEIYSYVVTELTKLKHHFRRKDFEPIISYGDTPSCSLLNDFNLLDEIRPGNFVFFDIMQYTLGVCTFEDIAVAIVAPVVSKNNQRSELVIHCGAIHLSKDFIIDKNGNTIYGTVSELSANGWVEPDFQNHVCSLSQEHGIIKASKQLFKKVKIGDLLAILPVHSCLAAQHMGSYYSKKSGTIFTLNSQNQLLC